MDQGKVPQVSAQVHPARWSHHSSPNHGVTHQSSSFYNILFSVAIVVLGAAADIEIKQLRTPGHMHFQNNLTLFGILSPDFAIIQNLLIDS